MQCFQGTSLKTWGIYSNTGLHVLENSMSVVFAGWMELSFIWRNETRITIFQNIQQLGCSPWNHLALVRSRDVTCFDPVIWENAFKGETVDDQLTWMHTTFLTYLVQKKKKKTYKGYFWEQGLLQGRSYPPLRQWLQSHFIWLWSGWDLCLAVKPVGQEAFLLVPVL